MALDDVHFLRGKQRGARKKGDPLPKALSGCIIASLELQTVWAQRHPAICNGARSDQLLQKLPLRRVALQILFLPELVSVVNRVTCLRPPVNGCSSEIHDTSPGSLGPLGMPGHGEGKVLDRPFLGGSFVRRMRKRAQRATPVLEM